MENPVIIFGANHLGRAAKEVFEANGNVVYCFLDDDKKLQTQEEYEEDESNRINRSGKVTSAKDDDTEPYDNEDDQAH